jgi:hypothetical protein
LTDSLSSAWAPDRLWTSRESRQGRHIGAQKHIGLCVLPGFFEMKFGDNGNKGYTFVRHETELNGMKTDLLFLALAEIYRELLFFD